jgi:phosphatidylinositol alpha-mannosyltransferase
VGRTVGIPWKGTIVPLSCSYRAFLRIVRLMRAFRPDVVHVHEPFAPSTSMMTTLLSPVPVVATFHAFSERALALETWAPLLHTVAASITAAVAVSEAAAELAARVMPERFEIVPNGVPVARFAPIGRQRASRPRERTVLWVHRLEPRKGFAVAVRAFAQLAADIDDVRFVVVGEGSERQALALLPDRLRRRVVMLGAVPDEALPAHYAAADVFVASAVGPESFGVALVEAMAASLPVVASDIRGYRDVVRHGIDGLLVPPHDPEMLAGALRRVLTDPRLATALGRAGQARARRFSWEVVAPRIEEIYARAVRTKRPGTIERFRLRPFSSPARRRLVAAATPAAHARTAQPANASTR